MPQGEMLPGGPSDWPDHNLNTIQHSKDMFVLSDMGLQKEDEPCNHMQWITFSVIFLHIDIWEPLNSDLA